jgi:predicted MFS family arabinose efflux permease
VSVSLAGIVTPLLIGALAATALSWRFAFVLGAGTAGLAAVCLRRRRPPPPAGGRSGTPSPNARSAAGWRQPTLIVVFAIVGLEFSLSFWLATYLDDEIGMGRDAAAAAVSGLYAASLAGRLLVSRLARRTSAERLLAAALGTALLGLPVLLIATNASVAAIGVAVAGLLVLPVLTLVAAGALYRHGTR